MRAPVVFSSNRPVLAVAALALAIVLGSAPVFADEAPEGALASPAVASELASEGKPADAGSAMLAGALSAGSLRVSADVALGEDPEPVLGSFTADGLTYAVTGEGEAMLVAVAPGVLASNLAVGSPGAEGASRGIGSGAPSSSPRSAAEQAPSGAVSPQPQPAPSADASGLDGTAGAPIADSAVYGLLFTGGEDGSDESDGASRESVALAIPASVTYGGSIYAVASVGPRALVGCDAAAVVLPATVEAVDEAATRGSSVEAIEVADGNQHLASYEGVLYDADYSHLLLIPEGKKDVVRIHKNTSSIAPGAFSHCASVTSVEVDAGNETFSVRDGELLDICNKSLTDRIDRQADRSVDDMLLADLGSKEIVAAFRPADYYVNVSADGGSIKAFWDWAGYPDYSSKYDHFTTITDPVAIYSWYYYWTQYHGNYRPRLAQSANTNASTGNVYSIYLEPLETLGNEFLGWRWNGKAYPATSSTGYKLTQNGDSLIALFGANSYTIHFDPRGGDPVSSVATRSDECPVLPCCSRPGYDFLGWGLSADGSGELFAPDSELARPLTRENGGAVTLYAQWEACSYSIRYDLAGGYFASEPPDSYRSDSEALVPPAVKRGYTFLGWEGDGIVGNPDLSATIPAGSSGDKLLAARFSGPNGYGIRYELAGGELPEGAPTAYRYGTALEIPAPSRRGLLFEGWTMVGDDTPPRHPYLIDDDHVGDVTLVAHWRLKDYLVRCDQGFASEGEESPDSSSWEAMLNVESEDCALPSIARPGHAFIGWVPLAQPGYRDLIGYENGTYVVHPSSLGDDLIDQPPNGVTLVARWTTVLSVDAPASATFFADMALRGQGSREAQVDGVLGQAKASNKGAAALRVVGLDCQPAAGAEAVLSGGTGDVLSVYPAERLLTAEEAQASEGASAKPVGAVDFSLNDVLIERDFVGKGFTIPAGGELVLGYRLNLAETGTRLDYSRLPQGAGGTLPLASISYTFAVAE